MSVFAGLWNTTRVDSLEFVAKAVVAWCSVCVEAKLLLIVALWALNCTFLTLLSSCAWHLFTGFFIDKTSKNAVCSAAALFFFMCKSKHLL